MLVIPPVRDVIDIIDRPIQVQWESMLMQTDHAA
jgi:hypothetical protein